MQVTAIWLTDDEIEQLEMHAPSLRDRLLIQLGAYCGLRINETARAQVGDFHEENVDGDLHYFLDVEGKQTDQEAGGETEKKERETWVPREVWKNYRTLVNERNLAPTNHLIQSRNGGGLHPDSARKRVKAIALDAADATGNERLGDVSSHDLRRYFAHTLLEERGVNPRVVMDLGGWEDFQSIEPYLNKPSRSTKARELSSAGWD